MVAWVPFDIGEHGGLVKIKALFVLFGLTSVPEQFDKVRESRMSVYVCTAGPWDYSTVLPSRLQFNKHN